MTDQKIKAEENNSLNKKLKKRLKKLEIQSQADLINLMISVVARRISIEDIALKNWLGQKVPGLSISYERADEDVICVLLDYDLSQLVSEADSFLAAMKRTETGSFYTPLKWVKYMTRIALADWLADLLGIESAHAVKVILKLDSKTALTAFEQEACLSLEEIEKVISAIYEIRIIDIACGAGAFLLEAVELLTNVYVNLHAILDRKVDRNSTAVHFYESQVSGIDLQAEPLAVYVLCLLWRYGRPESWQTMPSLFCGDSLLDKDMVKAQDKYDIVLGNPPYLGEKGNTSVFKEIRKSEFGKRHYEGKMDLSYFFTLRSLELMKACGRLVYLTTNYFITADGAGKYRKALQTQSYFTHILNFNTYPVFKDALGQHNMVFMLKKHRNETKSIDKIEDNTALIRYVNSTAVSEKADFDYRQILLSQQNPKYMNEYTCKASELFTADGTISILSDDNHKVIIDAYERFCDGRLKDVFHINQGIVSGADQVSGLMLRSKLSKKAIRQHGLDKGQPIFVFDKEDQALQALEKNIMRPFYKNSDIGLYRVMPRTERTILYLDGYDADTETKYPKVMAHLEKFRSVLESRREVKTGTRPWYALQWPRRPDVFEGKKIVVPQRSKINRFAYTDKPFYCSADVYYFKEKHQSTLFSKNEEGFWMYYLGMLNSSVMYLWLYQNGKRKGDLLELYAKPLLETLVPLYKGAPWQNEIAELVKQILQLEGRASLDIYHRRIDRIIFDMMDLGHEAVERTIEFYDRHKNI